MTDEEIRTVALGLVNRERGDQIELGHTIQADLERYHTAYDWLAAFDHEYGRLQGVCDTVDDGEANPDDIKRGFVRLSALCLAAVEWYLALQEDAETPDER